MYANILCPVDLSDEHSWDKALPIAVQLAEAFGATLHVLTVVPAFGLPMVGQYFPEGFEAKMRAEAARHLEEFCAAHLPPDLATRRIVAEGKIYQEILRAADSMEAPLVGVLAAAVALGEPLGAREALALALTLRRGVARDSTDGLSGPALPRPERRRRHIVRTSARIARSKAVLVPIIHCIWRMVARTTASS